MSRGLTLAGRPQTPVRHDAGMARSRRGLVRPRGGRWLGGVCAGIARRFGWSPGLVRVAFVVSCILPGPQVLLYVLLWILIPSDD